jgi:hypothetical protein
MAAGAFYGGPVARAKRKKAGGVPGFGAAWRGKWGREGGGPDAGSGAVARPEQAAGHGESGTCAADRRGRAKSGPCGSGWVWEGVRGSEAVAASGADRRARPAQRRPVRF